MSARTHGHTSNGRISSTYAAWYAMKGRCYNPRCAGFKNYGGRGIKVCDRWLNSFESFLADMGEKPSPELSLDRINNNGNYEPGNCRWATSSQQARNKRPRKGIARHLITVDGVTLGVNQWARRLGIRSSTMSLRIRNHGEEAAVRIGGALSTWSRAKISKEKL